MTREAVPMDLDQINLPSLAQLAQDVRRTKTPVVLRENGEDVAVLSPFAPAKPKRRAPKSLTPAQRDAFLSSAGGWRGLVDVERFTRDINAARSDHRRPVKL